MITRPLCILGFDVVGVDMDAASIEYGQKLFQFDDLKSNKIRNCDLRDIDFTPDVIIASEVIEHIPDVELSSVLQIIKKKLGRDGVLFITVPNGYGWFEIESFLWFKTGIGFVLNKTRAARLISLSKKMLFGRDIESKHPSTVADSPHVQRFTYKSIQDVLTREGFIVKDIKGSVMFAGPFSDLLFTGIKPIMYLNSIIGSLFPKLAAGFYCYCVPAKNDIVNKTSNSRIVRGPDGE